MQNNFITRDTQNRWDANLNPPNPRDTVMAMEDGFTIHSGAFGDGVPMTNYTESELGLPAPEPETFAAEEDNSTTVEEPIPGLKVEPTTPRLGELVKSFNDWITQNLGYTLIGVAVVGGIYWAGVRSSK
jgi:hypothetical protein